MSWVLDEYIETSAGRVAAGRYGSGRDLILAHGWPWSSFSWHRVIPELGKNFRVHWYDMPGYGKSEKHEEQITSLDVQGEIFVEVSEHWKLNEPLVVAHDFGGVTTLRAHLLHGCNFGKYALMNVVAMRPWGSEFFDHVGRHVDAFSGLPPHIHQAVVEAYIRGAIVGHIKPEDIQALVTPWLDDQGKNSFYKQFALADERFTAEVESMFGDIRCPVNIIWGADDPWIPIARGRALHELVPHAEFVELTGVGHLPQLEDPSQVADVLNAFFLKDD
ncbi:MAG: alpha/beta hydrolase [Pseudomonadota bacterium]